MNSNYYIKLCKYQNYKALKFYFIVQKIKIQIAKINEFAQSLTKLNQAIGIDLIETKIQY